VSVRVDDRTAVGTPVQFKAKSNFAIDLSAK
jgi:hypothetical protein